MRLVIFKRNENYAHQHEIRMERSKALLTSDLGKIWSVELHLVGEFSTIDDDQPSQGKLSGASLIIGIAVAWTILPGINNSAELTYVGEIF